MDRLRSSALLELEALEGAPGLQLYRLRKSEGGPGFRICGVQLQVGALAIDFAVAVAAPALRALPFAEHERFTHTTFCILRAARG
jgi:hypothetical protein